MEIRGTWRSGYEYRIIFSGLDLDVLKAVVREKQLQRSLERRGLEDITNTEKDIANWGSSRKKRIIHTSSLDELKSWLDDFAERTDAEVEEIPNVTMRPAFNNEFITERAKLGEHAQYLANIIGEKLADAADNTSTVTEVDEGINLLLSENFKSKTDRNS